MPSLRLLSVAILVGMGATVAALGGVGKSGESGSQLSGSLLTARPTASATAAPTTLTGTLSVDATATGGAAASGAATAPGAATSGAAFDVRAENQRAGTPGWRITKAQGTKADLAGYAGAVSVLPGHSVPLFVSGTGSVRVRALRIGWYGGVGARQVWEGTLQAGPGGTDPQTWRSAGSVDTTGWPEGHYLLRLDQGDASRYLPLTVRSADNNGRVVILTSPMTWVAENGTGSAPSTISFNRPYSAGYGAAGFLTQDAGLVQLAERTGRRIGWVTDYDVATDPSLLTGAAAILTGGDSQYWPASLRKTIRAAGDAGTNLGFFGAGTGARPVRLLDAGRTVKIKATKPVTSVQLTGLRPSCSVTPAAEGSTGAEDAGWVVANADWWGYRDTGVKTDDVLPGLVSGRVDRAATLSAGSSTPMQVLAFTQTTCASDAKTVAQSGVYLVRPSGAGVFATGTGQWACALMNTCTDQSGAPVKLSKKTRRVASRITRNVVKAFAETAAGKKLAAKDTASQYSALR